jgi:phosphopantetheinyl transferase (holo-ACP synthase)
MRPPGNPAIAIHVHSVEPDGFDQRMFTAVEIARAASAPDRDSALARIHCMKEALRKCDPALATLDFTEIQVDEDADGNPRACTLHSEGNRRLPHAVSAAHLGTIALAVVAFRPPTSAPDEESAEPLAAEPAPDTLAEGAHRLISVAAVLAAIVVSLLWFFSGF